MLGWRKHKLESRLQGEIYANDTTLMAESEEEQDNDSGDNLKAPPEEDTDIGQGLHLDIIFIVFDLDG